MNAQELITKINEYMANAEGVSMSDFAYCQLDDLPEEIGDFEVVFDERSGSEYDTKQVVMYFKKHDIYLAIDGYYSSWSGTDWSDAKFYEVEQKTRVETYYARKGESS